MQKFARLAKRTFVPEKFTDNSYQDGPWMRLFSSCSCLTVLPALACQLLIKMCIPLRNELITTVFLFQFQLLASKLFEPEPPAAGSQPASPSSLAAVDPVHSLRTGLFEALSRFFPDEMTHPRSNLIDLIPYFTEDADNM